MTADRRDPRACELDRYRPYWSAIDPAGLVMVDRGAELTVAGAAIASAAAAAHIVTHLDLGDLYDQRLADVVTAAAALPDNVIDGDDQWTEATRMADYGMVVHGCAHRLGAIADRTGFAPSWLRQIVVGRSTAGQADPAGALGWFLQRVTAAAEARALARSELDALEGLGVDVDTLARPDPAAIVLALLEDAARALGVEVRRGDLSGAAGALDRLIDTAVEVGVDRTVAAQTMADAYSTGGAAP